MDFRDSGLCLKPLGHFVFFRLGFGACRHSQAAQSQMDETDERKELRVIRKRIGLTQGAMAARLNVSQSAYEKYERGERGIPAALLEQAQGLPTEHEAVNRKALKLAKAARMAAEVRKRRFEDWIQGCWMLFLVSAIWLVVRITAQQVGGNFLRLGPNDEALGIAFLLFIGLTVLLANETCRRACYGLPIRNQRRAA